MTLDGDKILTMNEVAAIFRCNRKTVERWVKSNPNFPKPFKAGRKNLWKASEIEEYLEKSRKS